MLSIVSSVAFMATRALPPFPGVVVLKALSIAALAVVVLRVLGKGERARGVRRRRRGPRDSWILATALALSCLGDVFLQLGFRRYFLHGLVAFLLAHLTYVRLFTRSWPRPLQPSAGRTMLAALVLVYGLLMCAWMWTVLGRLLVPALAYAVAITAMVVSTILAGFSRPFVWVGALLFLISDSLLAAGLRMSMPLAGLLIWPTYYLGQYGIAIGFLREQVAADRASALSA